jgi:hypothetical protein
VDAEAAFLAGYALALVALATGLERLGRRSANPWASRVLAASRPPDISPNEVAADWPHSEVPVFHQGVGNVALAAALLLTAANVVRHHQPLELAVQLALLVLLATRIARAITTHRSHAPARDDS